jgi:hypothetical protein
MTSASGQGMSLATGSACRRPSMPPASAIRKRSQSQLASRRCVTLWRCIDGRVHGSAWPETACIRPDLAARGPVHANAMAVSAPAPGQGEVDRSDAGLRYSVPEGGKVRAGRCSSGIELALRFEHQVRAGLRARGQNLCAKQAVSSAGWGAEEINSCIVRPPLISWRPNPRSMDRHAALTLV